MNRIAIVGAGIAGLTLALEIDAVAEVTVFEKSRGYGGRMATKQAESCQFDHGVQFFTAKSERFSSFLGPHIAQGHVARWDAEFVEIESGEIVSRRSWVGGPPHYVGTPKMNALARKMAANLDVVVETRVAAIVESGSRWRLYDQDRARLGEFDWVILAIPAQQAFDLIPEAFGARAAIGQKRMQGCYSLMLGFARALPLDWQAAFVSGADISWISNDSSKPGRSGLYTLLVHSTNRWADANMDTGTQTVIEYLRQELERVSGANAATASHVGLHRWRYANIEKQDGQRFFIDPEQRLAAVGDWCIYGRVEAAYLAAYELAQTLVARL